MYNSFTSKKPKIKHQDKNLPGRSQDRTDGAKFAFVVVSIALVVMLVILEITGV